MELDSQTKRLIERFNSQSISASRVLLLWISALLVLWMSGLESKARDIDEYSDTRLAYARTRDRTLSRASLLAEAIPAKESNELQTLKSEKDNAKDKALVPFKLPGGVDIPIPIVWAPVTWIALVLGTLVFIMNERHTLSVLSARVASKLASTPELSPILNEALTEAPFWLAPVAKRPGQIATPSSCLAILGWRNDRTRTSLYIVGCALLIAIEIRVAALAFDFSSVFGSPHEQWLAPLVALTLVSISVLVIAHSLFPRPQPDFTPLDPLPFVKSRCSFMLAAAVSVLAVPLFFVSSRLPMRSLARSPRFRVNKSPRRSATLSLQSRGLHLNKRSGVVHYVLDSAQLLGVQGIKAENLTSVSAGEIKQPSETPHVNVARASATFELAALDFLEKGQFREACETLLMAVRYDKVRLEKRNKAPDLRILDLLAGLSFRHDLPDYFTQLLAQLNLKGANDLVEGQASPILTRVRKWQDPDSKWRKKWQDKSKPVNWCALPMQDTRDTGDERSSRSRAVLTCVSV